MNEIYNKLIEIADQVDRECGDIPCNECPLDKTVFVTIGVDKYFEKSICSLLYIFNRQLNKIKA